MLFISVILSVVGKKTFPSRPQSDFHMITYPPEKHMLAILPFEIPQEVATCRTVFRHLRVT